METTAAEPDAPAELLGSCHASWTTTLAAVSGNTWGGPIPDGAGLHCDMADGSDHTEPLPGSTIRITTYDDRYMLWFPHDPLPGEDEVPSVPPPFSPNVNVDQGRLLGTQTHPSPDGQLSVETRWEGRLID